MTADEQPFASGEGDTGRPPPAIGPGNRRVSQARRRSSRLACVECVEYGARSEVGRGWKAEFAPDDEGTDEPEVPIYCPGCWAAEFGDSDFSRFHRGLHRTSLCDLRDTPDPQELAIPACLGVAGRPIRDSILCPQSNEQTDLATLVVWSAGPVLRDPMRSRSRLWKSPASSRVRHHAGDHADCGARCSRRRRHCQLQGRCPASRSWQGFGLV